MVRLNPPRNIDTFQNAGDTEIAQPAPAPSPAIPTDSSGADRITNAQHMVIVATDLKNDYEAIKLSQFTTTEIQGELDSQVQTLRAKRKDLDIAIQTYEQDFLEKRKQLPAPREKIQTLQDTVLAIFFGSYILITLVICAYVSRSTNSFTFFLVALIVMGGLGVVIAQVLIRFA